ncbi:class I SAM-dependent methyltransferase [Shinella sp. DD12]|uniref:class I SAM-dependent methyltransferase n=1 Tax=Shinella sp. DD12 TaxID=1410620 RepID=UPI0004379459|nr:class I SAM-dependent methyltransferase [Shinella sp. DD12]EYR80491.1 methyltransferase domain-containing protein [Shinella sp. DD12]
MAETTAEYWNRYYGTRTSPVPNIPSQFAAFVALEAAADSTIVDIGCGSGRDSLFFANAGFTVLGIDASSAAVSLCQRTAEERGINRASFLCCNVDDPTLSEKISSGTVGRIVIYARFFLHAIPEDAELAFLNTAAAVKNVDLLAIEFRTDRDAQQTKVTDSHYRRFIPPLDFLARAAKHGFSPAYFTEGFGYAKYRNDDAHVARVLMRKA